MCLRGIDWWFFQNPWGNGIYAGAFSNSKLAGVASLTPKRFIVGGQPLMGAEIGGTMTHRAFRGKGIFSLLVKHLLDAARERGYEVVFGTPNEASGRIYLDRLDFKSIFEFERFVRPLAWRRFGSPGGKIGESVAAAVGATVDRLVPLKLGNYRYSAGVEVESDLEEFLARACELSDCYLQRTADYVRWRLSSPEREYIHIYLRSTTDELHGWAAVRLIDHAGKRRGHIGDLWTHPKEPSTVRSLLGAVVLEARKRDMDEIYGISRSPDGNSAIPSHRFVRRRSLMPVIAFAPSGFDLSQLDGWEYRDSDADMF